MTNASPAAGAVAQAAIHAIQAVRDYTVHAVGQHRNAPRIFVEALRLLRVGFEPGVRYSISVDAAQRVVTLRVDPNGAHQVSRRGTGTPVLDINNRQLLEVFAEDRAVRMVMKADCIHFLPLASALAAKARLARVADKVASGKPLTSAAICAGGGFMTEALAQGYKAGGLQVAPAVVNDIDVEAVEHGLAQIPAVRDAGFTLCAPLQELVQDRWLMQRLPTVEIAELSLPCSGASTAGKAKRGTALAEEHPEVGHLIAPALMLLHAMQPAVVVMENVPAYRNSGSAWILRHSLRDMGYEVSEIELDGARFGAIEQRNRWFLVAATKGLGVSMEDMDSLPGDNATLGDILEQVPDDDPRWSTFAYLRSKQERDIAKGNGFMMQIVKPGDAQIPTLRKGYHKGGSTDPLLAHPNQSGLFRKLSASEHARAKGFDPELVRGLSETRAHELLGQAVLFAPLCAIGKRIAERLRGAMNATCALVPSYELRAATG